MEDKLAFLHTTCAVGSEGQQYRLGKLTTSLNIHGSKYLHTKPTTVPSYSYIFLSIKIQTLGAFLGTFACGILFLPSLVALLNCGTVTCPCLSLPTRMSLISVTQEGLGAGWSWDLKLCFPLLFKMQILFKMPQFGSFLHL